MDMEKAFDQPFTITGDQIQEILSKEGPFTEEESKAYFEKADAGQLSLNDLWIGLYRTAARFLPEDKQRDYDAVGDEIIRGYRLGRAKVEKEE